MRPTRRGVRLLPFVFLTFLAACGGGSDSPTTPADPGGSDPEEPGNTVQEVAAPALPSSNVSMLEPLDITGLPAGREYLFVELAAPNASVAVSSGNYTLPLLPLDAGGYRVWIPTHPTDETGGGPVELRVRGDGGFVTRPATLTLEPLPSAPGAFVELLDSLQAILDLRFAAAGTSAAEVLAADWDTELAPELVPLALVQSIVASPDNPADLRALAEGSTAFEPYFGAGGIDVGMLDSYTAAGGALDAVSGVLGALRTPSPSSGLPASATPGPQRAGSLSAAELDTQMEEAWAAADEIDPNSATGQLLTGYGFALGAAGVVAGPAGTVAAAALGTALWAYQTYLEGVSKLLPKEFVPGSLLFDIDIAAFEEDRPGPGTWSNVRVSAQSEGWSLDKAAVDLLLQIAGGAGAYKGWVNRIGAEANLAQDVGGFVRDQGLGQLAANSNGLVEIPPEVWPDVDISGTEWSEPRLGPGDAIALVDGTEQYNPVRTGEQLLTVSTHPSRFGAATPIFYRESVEVLAIGVSVLASKTTVQPNELIDFQILVENALDDDLSWTLSAGTWASGPEKIGQGTWSAQAQMPVSGFPVQVTFKSEAKGGARDTPGAPVREGRATLSNVAVIVDPPQKIMRKGDTQQFVATVVGATDPSVMWSVSGPGAATIGSNGSFIAPEELGDYLITATSVEDPSAEGFANVTVVGECYYSIDLGGEVFTGDEISHVFGTQGQFAATVSWTRPNGVGFMYPESLTSGVTGPVAAIFSFLEGDRAWVAAADEPVTLTITENTGDVVVGEAAGTVLTVVSGLEVPVPLFMEFRSLSVFSGSECTPSP